MGTNENSKNILISHDLTSEERTTFEGKESEEENEKRKELISLLIRKSKMVNKNEKS